MAKRAYARRYAQAAFEIAVETNELDKWQSDIRKIATLGEDAAISAVMASPRFLFDDKATVLAEYLGDISPLALNLVYLLVSRDAFSLVGDMADEYEELLNGYRGIETAEVITAVALDDEDKPRLEERLSAIIGKKVTVTPRIDPSLIGGIIARVGGKLIDGSTRSRLEALKRELSGLRG